MQIQFKEIVALNSSHKRGNRLSLGVPNSSSKPIRNSAWKWKNCQNWNNSLLTLRRHTVHEVNSIDEHIWMAVVSSHFGWTRRVFGLTAWLSYEIWGRTEKRKKTWYIKVNPSRNKNLFLGGRDQVQFNPWEGRSAKPFSQPRWAVSPTKEIDLAT